MLRSLLFVAIALVLLAFASSVAGYISYRRNTGQLRALAADRQGIDSWSRFLADFPHIDPALLQLTYKGLQLLTGIGNFPLLPEDTVYDELLIDDKELADLVAEIVRKSGGNFEHATEKIPADAVQTVRDVVNWVDKAIHIKDIEHGPN